MGFFSTLMSAASEANEETHGKRLLMHVHQHFDWLQTLDADVFQVFVLGYVQIRKRLHIECRNWTREGRIEVARAMQDQARREVDTDVSGSASRWLAGAWLESLSRNSQSAQIALGAIEAFDDQLRSKGVQI